MSGAVFVDSLPVKDMDLERWQEEITCVEQIPAIFTGTLRENIHIGNLSASAEQVELVLTKLHLDDTEGQQVVRKMLADKSKTRIFIQHNSDHIITADRIIQL